MLPRLALHLRQLFAAPASPPEVEAIPDHTALVEGVHKELAPGTTVWMEALFLPEVIIPMAIYRFVRGHIDRDQPQLLPKEHQDAWRSEALQQNHETKQRVRDDHSRQPLTKSLIGNDLEGDLEKQAEVAD